MKSFFKTFLASFLGSALILLIIVVLFVSSLASSLVSSSDKAVINPQTVLYMNLNYEIPDRTSPTSLGIAFGGMNFNFEEVDMAGMNDIMNNIKAAAIDPNIAGIFLELSSVGTSSAYQEEIRNQLLEFKKSGKFVISYADAYSQSAYYIASVADKIYMFPDGVLDIHGMASRTMFMKHFLDKMDIEMQIIRPENNRFKSAVEPYFMDQMSESNRQHMVFTRNAVDGDTTANHRYGTRCASE